MAKDSTQVATAGPNTNLWLAPVGTTIPATFATAMTSWTNIGYLKDPPSIDRTLTKTEINAWNASEPLRTLLESDVSTVTLNLMQENPDVFTLYFGPLIYTAEGSGGVSIEPNPLGADVERALCLELIDGANILRIFWRRCSVDSVGALSMDKADAISFEVTLKRLVPASGTAYKIQTNVAVLVAASA